MTTFVKRLIADSAPATDLPFLRDDVPSDHRVCSVHDLTLGDDIWTVCVDTHARRVRYLGTLTAIGSEITVAKDQGEERPVAITRLLLDALNVACGEEAPQTTSHFLCTSYEDAYALDTHIAFAIADRRAAELGLRLADVLEVA